MLPSERILVGAWSSVAAASVGVELALPGDESVPFHLVWAGLVLTTGLQWWPRSLTLTALTLTAIASGAPLVVRANQGEAGWEELVEAALVAMIAAVALWHVDRHRGLFEAVRRRAADERGQARARDLWSRQGSHEVRTHLTVARGLVELVGAEHPHAAEDVASVLSELDTASSTITRLLQQATTGRFVDVRAVDVDALLHRLRDRWGRVDRTLSVESCVGVAMVDSARLLSALDTLVENAVKFTHDGDAIVVTGAREHHQLVVSVSDSGPGLSAAETSSVLSVLRGGQSAGTHSGHGLGLTIVKAAVDVHRGSVDVCSVPGGGTRFVLRLPDMDPSDAGVVRPTATHRGGHHAACRWGSTRAGTRNPNRAVDAAPLEPRRQRQRVCSLILAVRNLGARPENGIKRDRDGTHPSTSR